MKTAFVGCLESPVGEVSVAVDDKGGLLWVGFETDPNGAMDRWLVGRGFVYTEDELRTHNAMSQLGEYFTGSRREFDLPLSLQGSSLQLSVWGLLRRIPYGETRTYGQLARQIGGDANARAVGGANASNPIAIVVPCHRVIGADGSLTGYAGGLPIKRWLLDFERRDTLF